MCCGVALVVAARDGGLESKGGGGWQNCPI
jgi:hypothetical protein